MMLAARAVKKQATGLAPQSKKQASPTRADGAARTEHVPTPGDDLQRYLGNSFLQSLAGNGLPAEHPTLHTSSALIQRQCHCGGTCTACTGKAAMPEGQGVTGQGHSLPGSTRAFFEARLGYDFSRVRVHTDARAAQSARALHASSYTAGQDIVFGAGEFSPSTAQGQRLLAHELTHVVQQGQSTSSPNRFVSSPRDAAEVEAERIGASILTPSSENSVALGVSAQPTAAVQRQAQPGEEFSPGAQPGFGLGTARTSPLRFGFGLRAGQQVTEGTLIEWAFEQSKQGVTFANLVRKVGDSYEFAGGSPEEKQRWISVLRGWEPELSAFRQEKQRQRAEREHTAQLKEIEEEVYRILFQERMQRYSGRVDIRKYPVLASHAAAGAVAQRLLSYAEIVISFIPVLGHVAAVVEVITGRGILTGRKLSVAERGLTALFAALPAAGKLIRAGKSAASAIVHISRKTRQLPEAVLRLVSGLDNVAPQARLLEEAMEITARGGTLTAQHQRALQSTAKALRDARMKPSTGAAPVARQGGEATTAARQGKKATSAGRQAEADQIVGTTSGNQQWIARLETVNPRLAEGAKKAMQSPQFKSASEKIQPLLNQINPCDGRMNCVPTTIATDMSLATGKVFKAPVDIVETGFKSVPTGKGRVVVKTFEEMGSQLHHAEAYVGANLNSGANTLARNLRQAGDGARAIVTDTTLGLRSGHAYNVINWRGMLIAIDGQSRAMIPFSALLIRLKELGKMGSLSWSRTN